MRLCVLTDDNKDTVVYMIHVFVSIGTTDSTDGVEAEEVDEAEEEEEPKEPPKPPEDDGRLLGITIHRSDRLKSDLYIAHPLVRVHLIDLDTGKYVKKSTV